ncbi:enhancer of mRNA-decapping protein 4-like [Maniola jurtina]|uniref:enhancer of mRNA-decapping protein 4-like n=1 Tax=Maniola jurtina TaxID=191418 RepID=UPI001E689701|nr:enhancer of mRNA-decapping protein 4-like [Maniola jurtina]
MISSKMQPTAMLPKLSETTQTISFSEDDEICSAEVYASNVVVTSNPGNHNHGSSKMKLKTLVDYHWQSRFYPGQLLAVHMSGEFLAYSIIGLSMGANSGTSKTPTGMVRVVYQPELGGEQRALIKGMKGEVQDLAFAHIENQAVLASIDEMGNFYIHELEGDGVNFNVTPVAEVREDTGVGGNTHRVVWCPYIPDEEDAPDDDVARLLLTTHANQARMWNIRAIIAACKSGGWVSAADALNMGAGREAGAHDGAVLDAAFSPDGTALATAAADGYVMFAQVYMNNESSPRCLHKWQPHDGKPLSSLFFLDNHKNYLTDSSVQFWKFAVTGAENNTYIKIWSCKSWACLQSFSFAPAPGAAPALLNARLDPSANYLLLSDFNARSLYVLEMARDGDDSLAYCKRISQFLLRYPVLSFCIVDAEEQQTKCESRCNDPFHTNGSGGDAVDSPIDYELHHHDDNGPLHCGTRVHIKLYIVHPKTLQLAQLVYEPPAPADRMLPLNDLEELTLEDGDADESAGLLPSSIIQQQTQQLKNLLMRTQTQPGSLMGPRPESPSSLPPPLNLMTPDAFSSPGKREDDDPPLSATPDISNKSILSGGVNEEVPLGEVNKASGGSSPSREVQEIMGHNDQPFFTDMEEDEEATKQNSSQETEPASEAVAPVTDDLVPTGQLFNADLFTSPDKPPPPAKLTHANSDTSWPQISLAQITEANQRKASSEKSSTQSLSAPLLPLVAPSAPPVSDVSVIERYVVDEDTKNRLQSLEEDTKNRLQSLEEKLDNLTEMMSVQSRTIMSLRSETHAPRALLEESLQHTAATIDTALNAGWERIARVGESASAAAATAAGAGAARALEPLAHALQHELAAKLSATDRLLRDNIDKLANSKTIMERLSTAIATSLSGMVRDSFREALLDSIVPVMEKAHAQLFRQINHAFQNGTKEFTANTEAAARAAADRGGAAAAASLRTALERHAEALAQATPLQPQLFAVQIKEVVHGVLEKEVTWWREQTRSAVAASRAHSPAGNAASVADRQMQVSQIQSLMMSGDVNGAFQLALSASDLTLVVAACRAADPARVFGPPCRLKQHVLLSLVQQLAADMAKDTHLKHRYLEEAIMNLDTSNPVTREHLPGVVRELQKQIMGFLSSSPGHALSRQFRMLLMATEALVKSTA